MLIMVNDSIRHCNIKINVNNVLIPFCYFGNKIVNISLRLNENVRLMFTCLQYLLYSSYVDSTLRLYDIFVVAGEIAM